MAVIHGEAHAGQVMAVRGDSPAGPGDLSVEDDIGDVQLYP
jgi:hypothetical protein